MEWFSQKRNNSLPFWRKFLISESNGMIFSETKQHVIKLISKAVQRLQWPLRPKISPCHFSEYLRRSIRSIPCSFTTPGIADTWLKWKYLCKWFNILCIGAVSFSNEFQHNAFKVAKINFLLSPASSSIAKLIYNFTNRTLPISLQGRHVGSWKSFCWKMNTRSSQHKRTSFFQKLVHDQMSNPVP